MSLWLTCHGLCLFSVPCVQWGFANPVPGGHPTVFNARSETVDEKVMFRSLVEKKRCIVLGQAATHTRGKRERAAALLVST